jgi:hypothetical protein
MKSITVIQKCFYAFILLAFAATTIFAQPGGGGPSPNPIPGGGTPTPSVSNDFDIVGFELEGGTTVIRETMVNATISLKNKGGATKKTDHVNLTYIPDMAAYQKDPSKSKVEVRDIEFNTEGVAVVHLSFGGYLVAGTYQSKAIVNPNSSVAETNYNNNEQSIVVTANPHKVDIEFEFTNAIVFDNMESVGLTELRMNLKVGKKNTAGTVTWLVNNWFPREKDPENKAIDYKQANNNGGQGEATNISRVFQLKGISEEDFIVYETFAWDDDNNKEDLTDDEDDYMGKIMEQFSQIKNWSLTDAKLSNPGLKSDVKASYGLTAKAMITKRD